MRRFPHGPQLGDIFEKIVGGHVAVEAEVEVGAVEEEELAQDADEV